MQLRIRQIENGHNADILTVSVLARTILHEFYGPQMPASHIDFFLDSYQSKEAIQSQLDDNWEYYIIELEDVAIGYVGMEYKNQKLFLSKLYVLANQRNAGAGKASMELIDERAAARSVESIEVFVNTANERAIKFYQRWGFDSIEEISNTYESGHTEVDLRMRKSI